MNRLLIFILLFCGTLLLNAQIAFTPFPLNPHNLPIKDVFEGVQYSSIAFADVDGDNDQDVLITGNTNSTLGISILYINNGAGIYSEALGTPFEGVTASSVGFFDIDGDNDQDILITGLSNSGGPISKLYSNNGVGLYSEMTGAPFDGVYDSSIDFADVDGDNDQDVLITGKLLSGQAMTKLYTNNGSGIFTEMMGPPFESVHFSSIAFADIDGDNDQDVLITGDNNLGQKTSKLYTNNGLGVFTEVIGTPFYPVNSSSIAFADVDGDNDQDVLITGTDGINPNIAKLYINDSLGNFTEALSTPFDGVESSSIAFADIDGDNDQDVIITGQSNSTTKTAKLYTNDGTGTFTEVMGTPFGGVRFSSIAFADVDNDNDQDILITGEYTASLYTNDGLGNFVYISGSPFDDATSASVAFADVDGDNDQDVLISSKLYLNDGNGLFSKVTGTPFIGTYWGTSAFIDIDGDNDQDILMTGSQKLYKNNGSAVFTEVVGNPFVGETYSKFAFSDIDGDNDQDILIASSSSVKLLINNGLGNYTEVTGMPFNNIELASFAFFDADNDNDNDLLIMGIDINNPPYSIAKLYSNDGVGNFSEIPGTPFEFIFSAKLAFTDIDGDNDQDILITGEASSNLATTKLYTNNGNGSFIEVFGTPFEGVKNSSIAFVDIDVDNDQDVLITGENNSGQSITKLYTNDGSGIFTEEITTGLDSTSNSSFAFADVNGDNSPDVIITGLINSGEVMTKGYFTSIITTARNTKESTNKVRLSPNPNNGENIIVSGKEIETIKIFNLQGQLIKEIEISNEESIINLSNQPKGIYLIKALLKNGNLITEKLIIQ